jgi:hypothetical protein
MLARRLCLFGPHVRGYFFDSHGVVLTTRYGQDQVRHADSKTLGLQAAHVSEDTHLLSVLTWHLCCHKGAPTREPEPTRVLCSLLEIFRCPGCATSPKSTRATVSRHIFISAALEGAAQHSRRMSVVLEHIRSSGMLPSILDATADVFKRALNILGVCVAIMYYLQEKGRRIKLGIFLAAQLGYLFISLTLHRTYLRPLEN